MLYYLHKNRYLSLKEMFEALAIIPLPNWLGTDVTVTYCTNFSCTSVMFYFLTIEVNFNYLFPTWCCNCRGQYFYTLKDDCLVWTVIGWSDQRSIPWLRERAKLRRTAKHSQQRNSWRTEKTLCSYSVYNNCIFGSFDPGFS